MILQKEEITELKKLVKKYQEINAKCSILEEHLNRMKSDLDYLSLERDEIKRDEILLIADLKEKYGEEIINNEFLTQMIYEH